MIFYTHKFKEVYLSWKRLKPLIEKGPFKDIHSTYISIKGKHPRYSVPTWSHVLSLDLKLECNIGKRASRDINQACLEKGTLCLPFSDSHLPLS